jgi:cobalt-zinc-cadmium efflux system protein
MSNDHHNHHDATKNIRLAFFLNVAFTIFEVIGGFYVNSVAILSDALHDLGDSISLGLSWGLERKSVQKADAKYTFGYRRFSLLAALINSIILIVGSVFVIQEAVERLLHPEHSDAQGMVLIAIIGVAVNGYAAYRVGKGQSMNERVLSWHLLEDVLGWALILIGSIVLLFWDIPQLDPILSLAISAFILWGVIRRLRDTLRIFLQATPSDVDLEELKQRILDLEEVESIHRPHVWSMDGESHVFSSHVVVRGINDLKGMEAIRHKVKSLVDDAGVQHHTIEIEILEEKKPMKYD